MPIWWPCWMSAAASSADMMRWASAGFRTRVGEATEVDIVMPFEQEVSPDGARIRLAAGENSVSEASHKQESFAQRRCASEIGYDKA